ncbi:MAG: hypothetical protein LBU51_03870 [Bacteroidales bacterium]|jgi:cell division protein FtsI (penicillin-binding protein 3)|nr:hypothetical protein [Bacteroidales bacterium]
MSEEKTIRSNSRIVVVYTLLFLLGVACITRIIMLVVKDATFFSGLDTSKCLDETVPDWQDNPLLLDTNCNCRIKENFYDARRGDIYDDLDRPLAADNVIFDIYLDGKTFNTTADKQKSSPYHICQTDKDSLDRLINDVATQFYTVFKDKFSYDLVYYENQVAKSLKSTTKAFPIVRSVKADDKRWVTIEDTAKLKQNKFFAQKIQVSGLNFKPTSIRIHLLGEIGKRTIGVKLNGVTYVGLEGEYNEYLEGQKGVEKVLEYNHVKIPLKNSVPAIDGANVHTTLNRDIQVIVHKELMQTLKTHGGEWGCAVVMETTTGEIKAVSNIAYNKYIEDYNESATNYLMRQIVEPGSTFKLASLLAYLEKKPNDNTTKYPVGQHRFQGQKDVSIDDRQNPKPEEYVLPIEVISRSSNVGIASMVFDAYKKRKDFLSILSQLHITDTFKTQLGRVATPQLYPKNSDFFTFYTNCFGTGIAIAPVITLTYFNAVANGGKMVKPMFVKSITRLQEPVIRYQTEVIDPQISSPANIEKAKKYLLAVVEGEHGSARKYKSPHFRFAGKTGTRDYWNAIAKEYDFSRNNVSFCGFFPYENPKYTCLIYIYNVKGVQSYIATNMFVKIAEKILNLVNYEILPNIKIPEVLPPLSFSVTSAYDAKNIFKALSYDIKQDNIKNPYFFKDEKNIKGYDPALNKDHVPNVINMIASDAIHELTKAGYKVVIQGKGRVKKQELQKDKKTVTITLN